MSDRFRREHLLNKFKHSSLSRDEARELRNILVHEKDNAANAGDAALLLTITLLLALVTDYLTKDRNPLQFLENLFDFGSKKKKRIPA